MIKASISQSHNTCKKFIEFIEFVELPQFVEFVE